MRALDTDESAPTFVEGFQIYCNLIKPHMGLGNKTPAEAAGINLELNGGNRWLELIKKGTNHK